MFALLGFSLSSSSHIILSLVFVGVVLVVVVVGMLGGMAELISALGKIFSFCFSAASNRAASAGFVEL